MSRRRWRKKKRQRKIISMKRLLLRMCVRRHSVGGMQGVTQRLDPASVEEILTQWRLGVWKRGRKTTYRH